MDDSSGPETFQTDPGFFGISAEDSDNPTLRKNLQIISEFKNLVGVFQLNSDDPKKLSNIIGDVIIRSWSMKKILGRKEFSLCSSREIISLSQHRKEIQQFLVALSNKSRSYVYNPEFTTLTSLPLDLFCGYQLLQGSNLMLELGDILLLDALKSNRCDYVRVFLNQGVQFGNNLPELYDQVLS
ncbi:uncharacterized protein LOC144624732 [Crassostrea virginica]